MKPRNVLRLTIALVVLVMTLPGESSHGAVELFNGRDLTGWKVKGDPTKSKWAVGAPEMSKDNPKLLTLKEGEGALVNLAQRHGDSLDLYSEEKFGDSRIELELMVPKGSNSGIYVMGEYEVQVLDSYGRETMGPGDMGAIYGAAPPPINACKKPGEWQKYVIEFRAPRFDAFGNKTRNAEFMKVELNGQMLHENLEMPGPTPGGVTGKEAPVGPIMFQGNHGPVAYRKIRIAELAGESRDGLSVTAKMEKDRIEVAVGGKPFTSYKFAASQKYPYFWPVNGPASGKSVTTESSEPYPHHHSLFFGCDRVNGGNYWQDVNERGQILSQGPKIVEAAGGRIVFTDECLWRQPEKEPVMRDRRRVVISAPSEKIRLIDFEIQLEPLTDVRILKTNHSLFSARVAPELSVKSGGALVNAEGKSGEKETFGVASPWCDYSGTRPNATVVEGIAILQRPSNRWYPARWFTRDYGFFSPTPMQWLEEDRLDLPKGETLALRYRVVVHEGDAESAGIARIFAQYEESDR